MRQRQNAPIFVALVAIVLIVLALALAGGSGGMTTSSTTPTIVTAPISVTASSILFQPGIEGKLSASQRSAFERLRNQSNVEPSLRAENGVVRFMTMAIHIPNSRAASASGKALAFVQDYHDLFDIESPSQNLTVTSVVTDSKGGKYVTLLQTVQGVPVYGAMVKIHISTSDEVESVSSAYIPGPISVNTPTFSPEQAKNAASQSLGVTDAIALSQPELILFDEVVLGAATSQPVLVWRVELTSEQVGSKWIFLIDAHSGENVRRFSTLRPQTREVWDNKSNPYTNLQNASQLMAESGCLPNVQCDQDAQQAYDFSGEYLRFLADRFNRDSYDGNGASVKSYVHVKFPVWWIFNQPNAAWGGDAIFYSDGYSSANDVVAHELTHALIDFAVEGGGLIYERQSGALNESYADVFGVLVDSNDWLLGEDLPKDFLAKIAGLFSKCKATRDMAMPSNCGQPEHWNGFKSLPTGEKPDQDKNDLGYVHDNSGIPNKAAYLVAAGGAFHGITVQGIGREKLGQIYFHTIDDYLLPSATFRDARDGTLAACSNLVGQHGITNDDCRQIANAFAAVGIGSIGQNLPYGNIAGSSSTVLVFDTSGSMNEPDASGNTKLQAARAAGNNILDIIAAENQSQGTSTSQIGVVDFNVTTRVDSPPSSDISAAQSSLQQFTANGGTGMPDGLKAAVDLFSNNTPGTKPLVILLSDGQPNIGHGGNQVDKSTVRQQVLDQAARAGQQGICIYTVGFGVPQAIGTVSGESSIDEDFLRQVASTSGCGTYYNAQNATQLANVYAELRHVSMGNLLLKQSGQIAQGQLVEIGTVQVPVNQSQILLTLNWPGSRLEPILTDPTGKQIDSDYPGASLSSSTTIATVIVSNPRQGDWKVAAQGVEVPEGVTTYNALVSARQGTAPAATVPTTSPGPAIVVVLAAIAAGGVAVYTLARRQSSTRGPRGTAIREATAILAITAGPLTGQSISVPTSGLMIGRGSTCNLRLQDSSVSRRHAQIRYAQGAWFIQDLGSSGGTLVNGERIQAARLNVGDRIQIGSSVFTIHL